jgi:hypothetical protein
MDGMGCSPALDRPSSSLGNEKNRPLTLTERNRCNSRKTWRLNFTGPRHESDRA